jgi:hypothetical protein
MDLMTTLVVSSSAGGAAGSVIKELSSNGMQWLVTLVTVFVNEVVASII